MFSEFSAVAVILRCFASDLSLWGSSFELELLVVIISTCTYVCVCRYSGW